MDSLYLPNLTKVIAISGYIRDEILKEGIPSEKIIVIPNPVVVDKPTSAAVEHVRQTYGLSPSSKTFGILGLLNGFCGIIDKGPKEGWGPITMVTDDDGLQVIRFELTPEAADDEPADPQDNPGDDGDEEDGG